MKFEEMCRSVSLKSFKDDSACIIEGGQGFNCILSYEGRSMSTPFSLGSGHRTFRGGEPHWNVKVADVMHSLLVDAAAADMDLEEWCDDFGYDTDSKKAEATYNKCRELGESVHRMLGDSFQDFQEAAQDF